MPRSTWPDLSCIIINAVIRGWDWIVFIIIGMAIYSKSLEDYFRIPVLVKPITPLSEKSNARLNALLYHRSYPLPVDERYPRHHQNPNTEILAQR